MTTLTTVTTTVPPAVPGESTTVNTYTSLFFEGNFFPTTPTASGTSSSSSSTSTSSSSTTTKEGPTRPGAQPPISTSSVSSSNQPITTGPSTSSDATSTKSSGGPISTSSTKAPGAQKPTVTPNPVPANNTGLIAAAAVLGALFLIALVALIILWFRQRRNNKRHRDAMLAESFPMTKDPNSPTSHEQTISELKASLHEKDAQLRESQAAMMQRARKGSKPQGPSLGDKEVSNRFRQLSKAINDWVLTYFKGVTSAPQMTPELKSMMARNKVNALSLLGDSRTKYLVVRLVVAEMLTDAINSGVLLGTTYTNLARPTRESASDGEFLEWQAQTVSMLVKHEPPFFRGECLNAIEGLTHRIDALLGPFSEASVMNEEQRRRRISSLQQHIVEPAAGLAIDLAQQAPETAGLYQISMEPAGTRFSTTLMEDVFQDHHGKESRADQKGSGLRGRSILATVFPTVTRAGGREEGVTGARSSSPSPIVISKGQVLT
ncbi:MAG: Transmembrane protein 63C [Chaenotheca gracillima]|nr:MAG: Transmembrane protein 63C [Chaenotheca gracillima]